VGSDGNQQDHDQAQKVRISFHDGDAKQITSWQTPVTIISFGSAQYRWHPARKKGYADPNDPPLNTTLAGGRDAVYTLPPASLDVLRGRVAPAAQSK
jgi:hypothetical protein